MEHLCYVETDATRAVVRMSPLVAIAHKARHDRLRRIERAAFAPIVKPKPVMMPAPPDPNYPPFNIQALHYHQMWFFDLVTERAPRLEPPSLAEIVRAVCCHYCVSRTDMMSERRYRAISTPRQVAMYLAKTLTMKSFPKIGHYLGKRDHTTVLHGFHKIEELLETDIALVASIETIKASLR